MKNKNTILERKATIFNIQKYNMYDGPGVRTIIFFQGCPLRCKWCSNPEGLEKMHKVMFKRNSCVNCGACVEVCPEGIHFISEKTHTHEINRNIKCTGCMECVKACYKNALSICGEEKTISELMDIIREDMAFYETSGGGVTLGGGEVLMQIEPAISLLMACKQEYINTAIETSGYTKMENIIKISKYVDLFLFDIKHIDSQKHFELTGVHNEIIIENLKALLENRSNVKIRMPLLQDINASKEEIRLVLKFLEPYKYYKNFKGIDLLPYHKMGVNKYEQLGMEYKISGEFTPSDKHLDELENFVKNEDFLIKVIKH